MTEKSHNFPKFSPIFPRLNRLKIEKLSAGMSEAEARKLHVSDITVSPPIEIFYYYIYYNKHVMIAIVIYNSFMKKYVLPKLSVTIQFENVTNRTKKTSIQLRTCQLRSLTSSEHFSG